MKCYFLSVCFLLLSTQLLGQSTETIRPYDLNNINLNILGSGANLSLHYERIFPIGYGFFAAGQIGLGYQKNHWLCQYCDPLTNDLWVFPVQVSALWGKRSYFIEAGFINSVFWDPQIKYNATSGFIAYRYWPIDDYHWNFRIILQFMDRSEIEDKPILVWPFGLSMGYCF